MHSSASASGVVLIGRHGSDTAKLMLIVVDAAPAAAATAERNTPHTPLTVFACGMGSPPTCPAIRRSLSQILRQKYTPKWAAACHDGLGRKFCTAGTGARADFAIARFKRPLFEPATPPVRQRPCRRRRTWSERKCIINAIICTLVISSPLALFRCLPSRVLLLLVWLVPAMCNDARHRFAPMAAGQPSCRRAAAGPTTVEVNKTRERFD